MNFEKLHPADQLVEMMNRIYRMGMTTTSGGNLSIQDENGDIWITPSGIDKGSLTREDIMQVKPDGRCIGKHKPSVEFPFHQAVYRCRPDIRGIVHAHPPVLAGFSILRQAPETRLTPETFTICGEVTQVPYNAPGTKELSKNVSARFAEGSRTVLMANHGIVCGAENLYRAFVAFETIVRCAEIQLKAAKLGALRTLTDTQIAAAKETLSFKEAEMIELPEEMAAREQLCALAHRCYERKLLSAAGGVISMRMADNSMLILPMETDRLALQPKDIVRVQCEFAETGKIPSMQAALHQKIYAEHPEINAIIISQPPSAMAFSVTGKCFDTRMLSEDYIVLGDVQHMACENGALNETEIVNALRPRRPAIAVDNRCIIVTGTSLINAFDRMEVLEYSADAVLAACEIGHPLPLSDAEIEGTNQALGLE